MASAREPLPQNVQNIGGEGIGNRLGKTTYAFAFTLSVVVVMRALSAPTWSFAVLFVPFTGCFLLAYQAMWKTCTFLASRGMRDVGDGHECIADPTEVARLRTRGRRITAYVVASAAVSTALVVAAMQ